MNEYHHREGPQLGPSSEKRAGGAIYNEIQHKVQRPQQEVNCIAKLFFFLLKINNQLALILVQKLQIIQRFSVF